MVFAVEPEVDEQDDDAEDEQGVGDVEYPGPQGEAADLGFDLDEVSHDRLRAGAGLEAADGVRPGILSARKIAEYDVRLRFADERADVATARGVGDVGFLGCSVIEITQRAAEDEPQGDVHGPA